MSDLEKAARMALEALELATTPLAKDRQEVLRARAALRQALEQPAQQEPVSIKAAAKKAGINLPETYIPTMDDAVAAGDSVLLNEQAALLRECRTALDSLIAQKPTLAGLLCGSTTLGNLRAELGAYRPQGVFGSRSQAPVDWEAVAADQAMTIAMMKAERKPWVGLTEEEIHDIYDEVARRELYNMAVTRRNIARAIEAKLKDKNGY